MFTEFDDVALTDLVLQKQEEPGEEILDQALCAEPHGQPHHASGAQDRRHADAEFAQDEHARHQ